MIWRENGWWRMAGIVMRTEKKDEKMGNTNITPANRIKQIIQENQDDIAFVIGNGINYHFNEDNFSWNDLLLSLWNEYSDNKVSNIPDGISYTEFFDVLELKIWGRLNFSKRTDRQSLQKRIQERLNDLIPNDAQNSVLRMIQTINAPILTTNFDDLIQKSMGLNFHKMTNKGFTDYYPWKCYFSDRKLKSPLSGFGVWHINGMARYYRSIKLSLSQYMGNVEKARRLIHAGVESSLFRGKDQINWAGQDSWLHIIFNKSLLIFGLGLEENEVFLRWLLIERAKYFKEFPNRKHQGWYVCKKNENDKAHQGKKFFLDHIGVKMLEVESYKTIYEDIWD